MATYQKNKCENVKSLKVTTRKKKESHRTRQQQCVFGKVSFFFVVSAVTFGYANNKLLLKVWQG
jgi:hypothetical protein